MIYVFVLFMIACGYYTFTYGVSLWRVDNNKLAAVGVAIGSIIGTISPIVVMFLKL